jgi:hypothetical protein
LKNELNHLAFFGTPFARRAAITTFHVHSPHLFPMHCRMLVRSRQ